MICTPALVYLVMSVLSIVFYFSKYSISTILFKGLFIGLWTWLLDYICSKGYSVVSWILVLLPFILFALIITFIFAHSIAHKENFTSFPGFQSPMMERFVSPINNTNQQMQQQQMFITEETDNVPVNEAFLQYRTKRPSVNLK